MRLSNKSHDQPGLVDLHLHKMRGKQNDSAVGVFWGGAGGGGEGALPCCFVYLHLFVCSLLICTTIETRQMSG